MTIHQDESGRLEKATRRQIAEKVLGRLDSPVRYDDKRFRLGAVLQMQARNLAVYLRGEREAYEPFVSSW